jgi:hypothetical protein
VQAEAKQLASYFLSLDLDLSLYRVETRETDVYNALSGEAFASLTEGWSRGGLAQLGEHYVRNVGVGGSTPLPSTTVVNRDARTQ